MDSLGEKIQEDKDKLINLMLIIFALVGGVVIGLSLTRAFYTGMNIGLWTQALGLCLIIPFAIFRKKIPYKVKVIFASLVPLVFGFMEMYSLGLMGGNVMLFLSSIFISSVLLGARAGITLVIFSFIYMGFLAYQALNGNLTFKVNESFYHYQFESWIVYISAFVALASISSYLIGQMASITYKNIEMLEEKTHELEEVNKTKDRLFQLISHDLRSPFQGLISGLELFIDDSNVFNEEHKKKLFQSMLRDSTSTFSMLENLLFWSKAKIGDLKLEKSYFELLDFVEASLMPYSRLARQKAIDTSIEADNHALAFADKSSVRIILSNLFQNAIKFTEHGGWIRIKIETLNDVSRITISDNGMGISEANLQKIFQPNERFTTRGTENESGTGLGISISLELAQLNSGRLLYNENESGGSDFILELPSKA